VFNSGFSRRKKTKLAQTATTDFDLWAVVLKSSLTYSVSKRFAYQGKESEKTFCLNRINLK
jgi:hypothetical protein